MKNLHKNQLKKYINMEFSSLKWLYTINGIYFLANSIT